VDYADLIQIYSQEGVFLNSFGSSSGGVMDIFPHPREDVLIIPLVYNQNAEVALCSGSTGETIRTIKIEDSKLSKRYHWKFRIPAAIGVAQDGNIIIRYRLGFAIFSYEGVLLSIPNQIFPEGSTIQLGDVVINQLGQLLVGCNDHVQVYA